MCVYLLFLLFSLNISRTSKCWNVRISTSDRFLDVEPFYIIALCMYFYCFLISNFLISVMDAYLDTYSFSLSTCPFVWSIKDANEKYVNGHFYLVAYPYPIFFLSRVYSRWGISNFHKPTSLGTKNETSNTWWTLSEETLLIHISFLSLIGSLVYCL